MIQPIKNYNKISFRHALNSPVTTSLESTSTNQDIKDTFKKQRVVDEQKSNAIKNGSLLIAASILISAFIQSLLSYKGKCRGISEQGLQKLRPSEPYFVSLKDDLSIPTLETCKSLDKNLKNLLEKQLKILKLQDSDEINLTNRILLYGPPGVGKSFYAKVFAKSIDAKYMEIKFSDYNSRWAGEDIENLTSIWEKIIAESSNNPKEKYVVTLNEIEASIQPIEELTGSGRISGHIMSKIEERDTVLNYLDILKEKCPNVIIFGTTNLSTKDSLDKAIISRFKQKISEVSFPEQDCLYEALVSKIKKLKNGNLFIEENKDELMKFSQNMHERTCSYRDLDVIFENAKEDCILNKEKEFNIKYLDKALKDIELTDGEIYKNKINKERG